MIANKSAFLPAIVGIWLGLSGPANAAGICLSDTEARADKVRILQSTLMVAALKCAHKPELELDTKYNRFVLRNQRALGVHADALKAHFQTRYGANYDVHLNRYVTRVANVISLGSFDDPRFCENVAALGSAVLKTGRAAVRAARFDMPLPTPPLLGKPCTGRQVAAGGGNTSPAASGK